MKQTTILLVILFGLSLYTQGLDLSVETSEKQQDCTLRNSFECDPDAICFHQSVLCNGISECQNGRDESVEICGCLPNEYQCNDTHCVDLIKRCNTIEDCDDGNDEENCETYECPDNFYKCDNHYCIPRDLECNFVNDCGDNSDEIRCKRRGCFTTEFQCNNKECVAVSYLCDGRLDCKDGSDEEPSKCEEHFLCPNGLYVHKLRVCDSWPDCAFTHYDEVNCGECTVDQYKCHNNQCISHSNHCDGVCDCTNCEDEDDCSFAGEACIVGEKYTCKNINKKKADLRCINKRYLCDGNNDCRNSADGVDEFYCSNDISDGCIGFKDIVDPFVCPEGRCFSKEKVRCDHYFDCLNGEDEKDCYFPACSDKEYRCDNEQCIPSYQRCDGNPDCFDRSDEAGCESLDCQPGYKRCKSGQCMMSGFWCDHWRDCPDNSDESACSYRACKEDEFECANGQCIPRDHV